MNIYAKFVTTGNIYSFEVENADTINSVITKIKDENICDGTINLNFSGKKLEIGRTLQDYNIQKEDVLTLNCSESNTTKPAGIFTSLIDDLIFLEKSAYSSTKNYYIKPNEMTESNFSLNIINNENINIGSSNDKIFGLEVNRNQNIFKNKQHALSIGIRAIGTESNLDDAKLGSYGIGINLIYVDNQTFLKFSNMFHVVQNETNFYNLRRKGYSSSFGFGHEFLLNDLKIFSKIIQKQQRNLDRSVVLIKKKCCYVVRIPQEDPLTPMESLLTNFKNLNIFFMPTFEFTNIELAGKDFTSNIPVSVSPAMAQQIKFEIFTGIKRKNFNLYLRTAYLKHRYEQSTLMIDDVKIKTNELQNTNEKIVGLGTSIYGLKKNIVFDFDLNTSGYDNQKREIRVMMGIKYKI
jgi:hypothetical protein